MNRERTEFLLSRLDDGDLTADERREVDVALAADASLSQVSADYSQLNDLLRETQPILAFDAEVMVAGIMDQLDASVEVEASPMKIGAPWYTRPVFRYAALLAVTLTAAALLWQTDAPPSPTATPKPQSEIVVNSTPSITVMPGTSIDPESPPVTNVAVGKVLTRNDSVAVDNSTGGDTSVAGEAPLVTFAKDKEELEEPVR